MRRSPRLSWSDQRRPGRVFGLCGCGGSRLFFPAIFAMRREPPKSVSQTLLHTGARAHVHDHGILAARLDRNRFGFGVGMGAV